MDKHDSYIIQKKYVLRLHYYLLLWRIYYALNRVEIYDSTAADSSDDEEEMDYLAESSGSEADWKFFRQTTNCIKIPLDYIMAGIN